MTALLFALGPDQFSEMALIRFSLFCTKLDNQCTDGADEHMYLHAKARYPFPSLYLG